MRYGRAIPWESPLNSACVATDLQSGENRNSIAERCIREAPVRRKTASTLCRANSCEIITRYGGANRGTEHMKI